jgi:hypothetical protein
MDYSNMIDALPVAVSAPIKMGVQLAELLTGDPVLDKIIRDRFGKQRLETLRSMGSVAEVAPSMELRGEEEPSKAGVIMTPAVVKELEEKRQKLIQTRMDLERQRRMDEYDERARARRMTVQDTLEKTGLDKR